ncbi:acylphosphatase [Microbulbifer harenosus]|uniref:acylphosphatase n=1 Tax=Microbulbifer harenosus TaxID=2576840 RepID=A0ABY2UM73_9GAMM|nr:acylphosphatase [Microbulbifer harenosus]TLM78412.1 hypothetical protein FDY93_06375 [Microbulbifer harenosus]
MSEIFPVESIVRESVENDYSNSPFLHVRDDIGISLLCHAANAMNLEVQRHRKLIFEVRDGQRSIVFRQNSPENSAVYAYCARQKHIAKKLMADAGVPVPAGDVFEDYPSALRYFLEFGGEVAVKPSDGSSGAGVSCGIGGEDEFNRAWKLARHHSARVIVEQNLTGQDIRVIVIGGKAEAAYVRTPAHVVGDGIHSIRDLMERKNRIRRNNPSLRYDPLRNVDLLERRNISLDTIPSTGERVQLASVANTSAGGETVEVLGLLDAESRRIAERAALCFPGLVQVGVDLMYCGVVPSAAHSPVYVIEVNSNPGICDAVFPSYGRAVDVPGKLLRHVLSTTTAASPRRLQVALAPVYRFSQFPRAFYQGERRQADLIKQAAFAHNLEIETLSDTVLRLRHGKFSCLFHGAIPECVRLVSRKITRNNDWMAEVLPCSEPHQQAGMGEGAGDESGRRLNHYRVLVIGNKVVAALYSQTAPQGMQTQVSRMDVSELIHPSVLSVLERTLQVIFDPFIAGIDLLMEDISRDACSQRWQVVNAVCNPHLGRHHFPDEGLPRDVAAVLLRELFPELPDSATRVACRVLVCGKVQHVGFRRWLKLMAVRHAVSGWVRNLEDGRVEAVLEGTERAVAQMVEQCKVGPLSAAVTHTEVESAPCFSRCSFSVLG